MSEYLKKLRCRDINGSYCVPIFGEVNVSEYFREVAVTKYLGKLPCPNI